MLQSGIYKASREGNIFQAYQYEMEVKETEKSFILKLVKAENRYADGQLDDMFGKSSKVVLRKDKPSRHSMQVWSDHDFTIYPYCVGVPFYFAKEDSHENS